jgi:phenylalanine-4-hydroxylase
MPEMINEWKNIRTLWAHTVFSLFKRRLAMEHQTEYVAKTPDHRGFIAYSAEENETWSILFERQMAGIHAAACSEYLTGLEQLDLPAKRAPQCAEVSASLTKATGWTVAPVPALIDADLFFRMLARREFPAASFIRRRDELNYLREPDLFHEIFGHAPLLTHPDFADFTEAYGRLGVQANAAEQDVLARLYWFTIEFGLIRKPGQQLQVYGAGIASSIGETAHALHDPHVERRPFDVDDILRTDFRIDRMQPHYFVLSHFSDLFETMDGDLLGHAREVVADESRNAA